MTMRSLMYRPLTKPPQMTGFAEDGPSLPGRHPRPDVSREHLLQILWLRYVRVKTCQDIAVDLALPEPKVRMCLLEVRTALDKIEPEEI